MVIARTIDHLHSTTGFREYENVLIIGAEANRFRGEVNHNRKYVCHFTGRGQHPYCNGSVGRRSD